MAGVSACRAGPRRGSSTHGQAIDAAKPRAAGLRAIAGRSAGGCAGCRARRRPEAGTRSVRVSWVEPDWPAPDGVRALSTLRTGGAGVAPYESLNLGGHVGD